MNERQEKVISRIFQEGTKGFKGGLSAKNYIKITGNLKPTATRDLSELVIKGALSKVGKKIYKISFKYISFLVFIALSNNQILFLLKAFYIT